MIVQILNGDRHNALADAHKQRRLKKHCQVFVNEMFRFLQVINTHFCNHYLSVSEQTLNLREISLEKHDIPNSQLKQNTALPQQ